VTVDTVVDTVDAIELCMFWLANRPAPLAVGPVMDDDDDDDDDDESGGGGGGVGDCDGDGGDGRGNTDEEDGEDGDSDVEMVNALPLIRVQPWSRNEWRSFFAPLSHSAVSVDKTDRTNTGGAKQKKETETEMKKDKHDGKKGAAFTDDMGGQHLSKKRKSIETSTGGAVYEVMMGSVDRFQARLASLSEHSCHGRRSVQLFLAKNEGVALKALAAITASSRPFESNRYLESSRYEYECTGKER
jgi:hypothetical protein